MRHQIHRQLKDIPSHSFDSDELYPGYDAPNPFSKPNMEQRNAKFYKDRVLKTKMVHMVYQRNGFNKVMQVSIAQERCYKAIKLYFTKSKSTSISKSTLLTLWREPTIKALVQKGLLVERSGDKIGLRG